MKRVAMEAGVGAYWYQYVGLDGKVRRRGSEHTHTDPVRGALRHVSARRHCVQGAWHDGRPPHQGMQGLHVNIAHSTALGFFDLCRKRLVCDEAPVVLPNRWRLQAPTVVFDLGSSLPQRAS